MAVLLDLKDRELAPVACGGCSGSSSDNKIRPQAEDLEPVTLASADWTLVAEEGGSRTGT